MATPHADRLQDGQPTTSLLRWLKHSAVIPGRSRRLFSVADRARLTEAVRRAEHGHAGEIQVVIEEALPLHLAYRQDTVQRARQLFRSLQVWDTYYRSGILLYVNLCARRIEVVADRGINEHVQPDSWMAVADEVVQAFQQGQYTPGIEAGIHRIGQILNDFYQDKSPQDRGNERPDAPLFL